MPNEVLGRLEEEVTRDTEVTAAAATLLNGLGTELKVIQAELAQQNVDNARLNELVDGVSANTNALAEAVAANTVADTGEGGNG